jgi:hypothetical protein
VAYSAPMVCLWRLDEALNGCFVIIKP